MLQPIYALRLSVAVLAVAVGSLWVKSWGAPTWDPRVEYAYPRIGIPWKDGRADLSGVSVRLERHPGYWVTFDQDGVGKFVCEYGAASPPGVWSISFSRPQMESLLRVLDDYDLVTEQHNCCFVECWVGERTITLQVGNRQFMQIDTWCGTIKTHTTASEVAWHRRFREMWEQSILSLGLDSRFVPQRSTW